MAYYATKYSTEASNILPGGKAGVALAVGDLVYLDSSGVWQLAVGVALGTTSRTDALGIMVKAALQYEFVSPVKSAEINGFTTLTIGSKQYLSATGTTGNTITATEPTATVRQVIGFASAADTIRVEIGASVGSDIDVGGDIYADTVTAAGLNSTAAVTVTTASASALTVGLAGATNPALKVDASTASSATGVSIKSAAAAGGVAIAAISSGDNEALTIDAKGSGTISLNATGTGNILLKRATVMTDAKDLSVGTTTGSKIGTAVSQKIGFWNATPVIQQASAAQAVVTTSVTTTATTTNLKTTVANVLTLLTRLRLDLVTTGIIKGAA